MSQYVVPTDLHSSPSVYTNSNCLALDERHSPKALFPSTTTADSARWVEIKETDLQQTQAILAFLTKIGRVVSRRHDYLTYLESDNWHTKRQIALDDADHQCAICTSETDLDVHHRTYDRLGDENPEDLIVLCRPCHKAFHAANRLQQP